LRLHSNPAFGTRRGLAARQTEWR